MPLFLGALLLGGILITAGVQGRNILDVALGREGHLPNSSPADLPAFTAPVPVQPGDVPNLTLAGGASGLSPGALRRMGGEVGPVTGNASLQKLVAECNRIAGLHLNYVWGGGHGGYPVNGPFDCSGAVSYVLHAAGFLKGPPRVSGLLALAGSPGPGQACTIYANAAHVFLDFGNVQWGTSHQNPGGGPGWHHRGHDGFTARHYPGM